MTVKFKIKILYSVSDFGEPYCLFSSLRPLFQREVLSCKEYSGGLISLQSRVEVLKKFYSRAYVQEW